MERIKSHAIAKKNYRVCYFVSLLILQEYLHSKLSVISREVFAEEYNLVTKLFYRNMMWQNLVEDLQCAVFLIAEN